MLLRCLLTEIYKYRRRLIFKFEGPVSPEQNGEKYREEGETELTLQAWELEKTKIEEKLKIPVHDFSDVPENALVSNETPGVVEDLVRFYRLSPQDKKDEVAAMIKDFLNSYMAEYERNLTQRFPRFSLEPAPAILHTFLLDAKTELQRCVIESDKTLSPEERKNRSAELFYNNKLVQAKMYFEAEPIYVLGERRLEDVYSAYYEKLIFLQRAYGATPRVINFSNELRTYMTRAMADVQKSAEKVEKRFLSDGEKERLEEAMNGAKSMEIIFDDNFWNAPGGIGYQVSHNLPIR